MTLRVVLFLLPMLITAGCGGSPGPHVQAPPACSGIQLSGTMVDSLTGKPVAQGLVSLQTGTQLAPLAIYSFAQTQQAASNADGSFSLCASSITQPAVVVLLALDASANS